VKDRFLLVLSLLACAFPLMAQDDAPPPPKWTVESSLEGGGLVKNDLVGDPLGRMELSSMVKVKCSMQKFFLEAKAGFQMKIVASETVGLVFDANESKEKLIMDYSFLSDKTRTSDFFIGGGLIPDKDNRLSFRYALKCKTDDPFKQNSTTDFLKTPITLRGSNVESSSDKWTHLLEGGWIHAFSSPGKTLEVNAVYEYDHTGRQDLWEVGKAYAENLETEIFREEVEKIYRLTPKNIDHLFLISGKYLDKNFCGVENLDVDACLNASLKVDRDGFSGATLVNEEWRDSLRIREDFDYLSVTVDPVIHATYKAGRLMMEVRTVPEYYNFRLQDASHHDKMGTGKFSLIGFVKMSWDATDRYRITLGASRSIKRPDYLQMCWYQRPGTHVNELIQGNVNLRPSLENKLVLQQSFRHKRFSSNLELGYLYKSRSIEKTYNNQEIDGVKYRVYTWINSGFSGTSNAKLDVKWSGIRFKADAGCNFNYFCGYNAAMKETRSSDFSLKANASYFWGKGWTTLLRSRYQSKIIRSYTSTTGYVGLDVRVSKVIGSHWNVFIEGNDLLDRDITTQTLSQDMKEGRAEVRTLNRRVVRLGASMKF